MREMTIPVVRWVASWLIAAAVVTGSLRTATADAYRITVDASLDIEPACGRMLLFFTTETLTRGRRRPPASGPFFDPPQPVASLAVAGVRPGQTITLDGSIESSFGPLYTLDGPVRVQAVLDTDTSERSHLDGPGNVIGDAVAVTLARDAHDVVELTLTRVIEGERTIPERDNLKWITFRSEMLSKFYGRDVYHRAGVALPRGHVTDAEPRDWPAVYVVPGFGGRHTMARSYSDMFNTPMIEETAPVAVHVVLDAESPLGHHGFVDSPNHGPRGTALVRELIPHLEERFGLAPQVSARIVTGHSSGGWSSLWLQLQWPDVFGASWSTAPDPVDFTAFQMSNIYDDASVFEAPDGTEQPSYRTLASRDGDMRVAMTVREEIAMERAMDPTGRSGQQWDAWNAMFSPPDTAAGHPQRLFDRRTGAIDPTVAEHWARFDIVRQVRRDPDGVGRTLAERARVLCGDLDSFYLNRAVERLRTAAEESAHDGDGYVLLIPDATHGSLLNKVFQRVNEEMRAYLRTQGFDRTGNSGGS